MSKLPHATRPTESQEERRSLFPFTVPLRRLRLAAAGQILSIGTALALLCALAVPDASAQPFTERKSGEDFNTLGLAGSNKNPVGLCAVKHPTNGRRYMLVSDSRDGKIYAYDLNSTDKTRLDSHHTTEDDFDLLATSTNLTETISTNQSGTISTNLTKTISTNQLSNPYGIWTDDTTLWVAEGSNFTDVTVTNRTDVTVTNRVGTVVTNTVTNIVTERVKYKREVHGNDAIKYSKIFAYTLSSTDVTWTNIRDVTQTNYGVLKGDRDTSKEFWLYHNGTNSQSNISPTGLWSDGTTLWVANSGRDRIFAYTLTNGSRDESKEFNLRGENKYAQGIWSDGETMWVSDFAGNEKDEDKKIFAYNLTTGARDSSKDYNTLKGAGNERPRGIWSDGKTMWVADKIDNKIYAYHGFRKTHDRNPNEDFNGLSAAENHNPRGIWSNETTMWVTDDRHDKLFAYDLATKERAEDKEFTLGTVDKFPQSLWSDGTTMWVAHFQRRRTNMVGEVTQAKESKIYAYNLATKTRDESKEFDTLLAAGNENPVGLWSDGPTMWVADSPDGKIYAYKMSDKSRDPSKDFDILLAAGNTNPKGIWSDGTTMWVAHFQRERTNMVGEVTQAKESKIYAYKMSDKSRDASKDYDTLLAAGNNSPFGIWSDNTTTMWVLDSTDDKIYAYNTDVEARLGRLVLKGLVPIPGEKDLEVKLSPLFNNGTMSYKASVPYATERLTLETKALRPIDGPPPGGSGGISYSRIGAVSNDDLEDVDDDKDDFQVDLTVGLNSFAITVINGNTNSLPRSRTYRVDVTREFYTFNDPSKNIDLHADNAEPRGVWANETTIWVADSEDHKLYAYKKANRTRDVAHDIPLATTNVNPRGIWSDGTTIWVANSATTAEGKKKLFAYTISTKSRDDGKDIILDSNNANPKWIWSDGVTMWVSDSVDNKLYAYDLVAKTYVSAKDVSLAGRASRNTSPTGMWADGASLWIADSDDGKIYAHKINEAGDAIDCWEEVRDFNTLKDAGNLNPAAIFSDRSTMYVVDNPLNGKKRIFAYNQPLSTNNKLKSLDLSGVYYHDQDFSQHFSSNETNYTNGVYVIYAAGFTTVAAVAQETDARVEVTKPVGGDADPNAAGYQVALPLGENTDIEITVTAENGAQKKYSVTILQENGGRTPIRDIYNADFHMMNANPAGLFGEDGGTTLYVADKGQKKIYAYDRTSDELGRDKLVIVSNSSFNNLASSNTLPWGIWANSETMWVTDEGNFKDAEEKEFVKIFAYNLNTKTRDADKDITLYEARRNFKGLWSDGTILYAAGAGQIYAFNVANGTPNSARSFNLDSNNGNSLGIWSDGTTMWVANGHTGDKANIKIYAYNLWKDSEGNPWTEDSEGDKIFDVTHDSAKDIDNLYETLKLNTINGNHAKEFNGGLWSDSITMWVSVVHTDTRGKRLYAFNLPQTPPPPDDVGTESESEDATLKGLRLSGVTLSPVFSPEKTYYTAQVAHDVASTTVTATPNDSAATVEIYWANQPASRRTANRGAQVTLEEGYNVIVMDVTAENGFVETYFVEVTKAEAPPVSGGPLPQPQSFQPSSTTSSANQADLAGSSIGLREGKSRLIFAEPLLDGGVRFVFLVPPEELKIETTPDLLGENWRLLPEDEFKATRESNVDGQDRLTIILPKAEGKQRFLRLTPQR